MKKFRRKRKNYESGAALMGYTILVAVLAIGTLVSVKSLGDKVAGKHWCKAVAGLNTDSNYLDGKPVWNEQMWDEESNSCNIDHTNMFQCYGWPGCVNN